MSRPARRRWPRAPYLHLAGIGGDADGVEAGQLAVELHVEVVGILSQPLLHSRLGAAHLHPGNAHRFHQAGRVDHRLAAGVHVETILPAAPRGLAGLPRIGRAGRVRRVPELRRRAFGRRADGGLGSDGAAMAPGDLAQLVHRVHAQADAAEDRRLQRHGAPIPPGPPGGIRDGKGIDDALDLDVDAAAAERHGLVTDGDVAPKPPS